MHVMQIVSGRRVNGAIKHCLLLSQELSARGYRVTLLCKPDSWIGRQIKPSDGIAVVPCELRRWPLDELRKMRTFVQRERVELIHSHVSRAHTFGVLLRFLTGVPSVASGQSRHVQLHWALNDYVIAASQATERFHRRFNLVSGQRISTVHNFIEVERFRPNPQARTRIRKAIGLGENELAVGVVGNVIARKGLNFLVSALPRILREWPRLRVVVVGDCSSRYYQHVAGLADKLGVASAMYWVGHCDDVPAVLAALDIYVLPSLEETMPLSVLEGMAAGLPVVATRVGGIPECVTSGEDGILVARANSEELGEAVIALATDAGLRQRLGRRGAETVAARFSPTSEVPRIEAIYREVLQRRASRAA